MVGQMLLNGIRIHGARDNVMATVKITDQLKLSKSHVMRPRMIVSATVIVVVLASFISCTDYGRTDALVEAGKAASNHLQSYYDHLTTLTMDWWEYQNAYSSLQGITTSQELQSVMTERLAALQARGAMAARLADVYDTVGQLRNPKSAQSAVAAAQTLGKTLSTVPKLPGGDLSSGLGQAADFLMGLKRDRDFATVNKGLTDAVRRISEIFVREQGTYEAFVHDRQHLRTTLIKELANRKLIHTAGLLDRVGLGVTWTDTDTEVARTIALNTEIIAAERIEASWHCATDETNTMLNFLVVAHEQVQNNTLPTPTALQRATAHAAGCLAQGVQKQ